MTVNINARGISFGINDFSAHEIVCIVRQTNNLLEEANAYVLVLIFRCKGQTPIEQELRDS